MCPSRAHHGGFSANNPPVPTGSVQCLNGNLVWALVSLGCAADERLEKAADWLARSITGDDFPWYSASGIIAPGFCCTINGRLPCAWGAVKSLRALAALPEPVQSPATTRALHQAAEFFLGHDLSKADYPHTVRISGEWFKFGFPLGYTSDVLETLLALCEAGYGRDPRLQKAVELVISCRGPDGRWLLKHSLNGKMWADVEKKGKPSKWVTLRALRVLKAVGAPVAGA